MPRQPSSQPRAGAVRVAGREGSQGGGVPGLHWGVVTCRSNSRATRGRGNSVRVPAAPAASVCRVSEPRSPQVIDRARSSIQVFCCGGPCAAAPVGLWVCAYGRASTVMPLLRCVCCCYAGCVCLSLGPVWQLHPSVVLRGSLRAACPCCLTLKQQANKGGLPVAAPAPCPRRRPRPLPRTCVVLG